MHTDQLTPGSFLLQAAVCRCQVELPAENPQYGNPAGGVGAP